MNNKKSKTKAYVYPKVPIMYKDDFPRGYRPWIDGWCFPINKLRGKLPDGTYKLLTLDISINTDDYVELVNKGLRASLSQRAEKNYKCEIGCKHCFECRTDTNNLLLSFKEVRQLMLQAEKLGLETVKFLGPGELLHNPKLFEILDFFEKENIKIGIFTKGVILGDDELAQKIFNCTAKDLCARLAGYSCVRLLIGFTSADKKTEAKRLQTNIKNFSAKRNRGIENIAALGFNSDPKCQKMALICTPVMKDNINEAFSIVKWGVMRNIPVVVAPTMVSGKGLEMAEINDNSFKRKSLVSLYAKIYSWMISRGIFTLKQLKKEGVSPYAGVVCSQFISGMFIRKDGRIQACPGNETAAFRYCNDIRKSNLRSVWKNSLGYKIRTELIKTHQLTVSQPCYAKTEGPLVLKGSIATDFYQLVIDKLKK